MFISLAFYCILHIFHTTILASLIPLPFTWETEEDQARSFMSKGSLQRVPQRTRVCKHTAVLANRDTSWCPVISSHRSWSVRRRNAGEFLLTASAHSPCCWSSRERSFCKWSRYFVPLGLVTAGDNTEEPGETLGWAWVPELPQS